MSRFILDLSDNLRAQLEAHRVRMGLRSHAEAVRALIAPEQLVKVTMPSGWDEPSNPGPVKGSWKRAPGDGKATVEFAIGPAPPKPGSRLKKGK